MSMGIFAVFDQAVQAYLEPFFTPTIEAAIRGFKDVCLTEGHVFAKFPEDYVLYQIGYFDSETGVVQNVEAHKIAMANSFVHGAQLNILDDKEDLA